MYNVNQNVCIYNYYVTYKWKKSKYVSANSTHFFIKKQHVSIKFYITNTGKFIFVYRFTVFYFLKYYLLGFSCQNQE